MDKKDLLGLELKSLMEEDTKDMTLSQESLDKILNPRKKGFIYKIKTFLNKEIEVPLTPAITGFAVFLVLASVPKGILKHESKEIIRIGDTQVIISSREVGRK